jgi:hypothetical protein
MVTAPATRRNNRYSQANKAQSLPDNLGLFGVVQLMAKNNDLSLQAFVRLEATPEISHQKV